MDLVRRLVEESNAIAGIQRAPTEEELAAYSLFFSLPRLTHKSIEALATALGGEYRGDGWHAQAVLARSIDLAEQNTERAHNLLCRCLPFDKNNGLIARAVWIWQQFHCAGATRLDRGFLYAWYRKG